MMNKLTCKSLPVLLLFGIQCACFTASAATSKIYAVIIGISRYKDSSLNLNYADRDAREFAGFLKSTNGGETPDDQIKLLLNEDASRNNVLYYVEKFALEASKDDVFILYYAGHGSNYTLNHNFYMMTCDTDPNRISSTATPGSSITDLLSSSKAKMTFWITDACNAGKLQPVKGGGRGTQIIPSGVDTYLKAIAESTGGSVYISSTQSQEVSIEDKKYAGGHGVFTYYLIKGLEGEADDNNDGIITINECFDYVRSKVIKESKGAQHPQLGDNYFNGNFPMALASGSLKGFTEARKAFLPAQRQPNGQGGSTLMPVTTGSDAAGMSGSARVQQNKYSESFNQPELKGGLCSYTDMILSEENTIAAILKFSSIGEKGKIVQITDTAHRSNYKFKMIINRTERDNGKVSLIFNPQDNLELNIMRPRGIDIHEFSCDIIFMNSDGTLYYQRAAPSDTQQDLCLNHILSSPKKFDGKLLK